FQHGPSTERNLRSAGFNYSTIKPKLAELVGEGLLTQKTRDSLDKPGTPEPYSLTDRGRKTAAEIIAKKEKGRFLVEWDWEKQRAFETLHNDIPPLPSLPAIAFFEGNKLRGLQPKLFRDPLVFSPKPPERVNKLPEGMRSATASELEEISKNLSARWKNFPRQVVWTVEDRRADS